MLVEAVMPQVEWKRSVDDMLEKITSDNAELFELLATNGKTKK